MQIKLINCDTSLLALGIDMKTIGSGTTFAVQLSLMITNYNDWEYDFIEDSLLIDVPDGTVIPDMSSFGELVPL